MGGLNIATYNVGRGLVHKLESIFARAKQVNIDILALQEISDDVLDHSLCASFGYDGIVYDNKLNAGVALLVQHSIVPLIRQRLINNSGRICGLTLQLQQHIATIMCVYCPTGLDWTPALSTQSSANNWLPSKDANDNDNEDEDEVVDDRNNQSILRKRHNCCMKIYDEIRKWQAGGDYCILMGDFNETRDDIDISDSSSRLHHSGKYINTLIDEGYEDTCPT